MDNLKDHIEKYLKGELSPREMHELEMKALHDPFIADALEGAELIHPNEFSDDVKSINKKIRTTGHNPYLWPLRIAASILLIATVYFVIIQTGTELNQEPLALQKNEPIDNLPIIQDADSNEMGIKPNEVQASKKEAENFTPQASEKPEIVKQSDLPIPKESEVIAQAYEYQDINLKDTSAISNETAIAAEEEISTQPFEELKREPTAARMKSLKKTEAQPKALSGAGATQTEASSSIADDKNVYLDESYQTYLKDNVVYPKAALDNNIEGTVTVSFKIDANGNPGNFTVEKGIGFGCDEELIRLIKEGPPWSPSQEKKVVNFTFEIKP